jgi:hypothetical protein
VPDAPQHTEGHGKHVTTAVVAGPGQGMKLPTEWIKAEAEAGRIPHLRIGKRYRFNLEAVIGTLADRAARPAEEGRHV